MTETYPVLPQIRENINILPDIDEIYRAQGICYACRKNTDESVVRPCECKIPIHPSCIRIQNSYIASPSNTNSDHDTCLKCGGKYKTTVTKTTQEITPLPRRIFDGLDFMVKWGAIICMILGYYVANTEFWLYITNLDEADYYFAYNFGGTLILPIFSYIIINRFHGFIKTKKHHDNSMLFLRAIIIERLVTSSICSSVNLIVQVILWNNESPYYKYNYFVYFIIKSSIFNGFIIIGLIISLLYWCYHQDTEIISAENVKYEDA